MAFTEHEPSAVPYLRVWVMTESKVYHEDPNCHALHRANRYHAPRQVPLAEATSNEPYSGQRRPCQLCATDA